MKNYLGQTEAEFIAKYNPDKYNKNKPSVTSDILVFTVQNNGKHDELSDKVLKILMVERLNFPDMSKWALPGGFIEKNETALSAAHRELEEETSIKDIYLEQLFTWDDINRDKRDRVISISHMALVDSAELNLEAGSDAKDAKWFEIIKDIARIDKVITPNGYIKKKYTNITLRNINLEIQGTILEIVKYENSRRTVTLELINKEDSNIAFDHLKMIYYGLQRLKNKVEWTDIAFNLLPEKFTIAEAYRIFQLTTGLEYSSINFRKKYSHMMKETNETTKKYSPRPAKLYKLNIDWDEE